MMNTMRGIAALAVAGSLTSVAGAQTPLYTLGGESTGSNFGSAVAWAGDVDADGFDDIIVGAPNTTTTVPSGGMARVYSGQSGAVIHEIRGKESFDFLGNAVACAGDLDLDGHSDFVVAVRGSDANGTNAGAVRLYSGRTGETLAVEFGDKAGDRFGTSIARVGDTDGDGIEDFAVGMPGSDGGSPDGGGVRVFSGASGVAIASHYGQQFNAGLGRTVRGAGDLNGDGRSDVLATSVQATLGHAVVFSVATGSVLLTLDGDPGGDDFGRSAACIGDADGDGVPDFVVGAPLSDTAAPAGGSALLFSGADGGLLRFVTSDTAGDMLGASVAAAGDVDGDQLADFAVGVPGHDPIVMVTGSGDDPDQILTKLTDVGQVRVFSGPTGQELFRVDGASEGGLFGWALANVGDANRDGVTDLASGALLDDRAVAEAGSTRVFSVGPLELTLDTHVASLTTGVVQELSVDLGAADAGKIFWVVGSLSGTYPGFENDAGHVPLNIDAYFGLTVIFPLEGLIDMPIGYLDADGRTEIHVVVPPGSDAGFAGSTLYHSAVVVHPLTFALEKATNAVPLTFVP